MATVSATALVSNQEERQTPLVIEEIWTPIEWTLGLDQDALNVGHMALRALIVFLAALGMVRIGEKRFLGKNTAFDVILGIIFGSVVSRAITGQSPFFPTLVAGLVLVLLHWLLSMIAFRFSRFGTVIKGSDRTLIRDGEIQWNSMARSHVSEDDLLQMLRVNASLAGPDDVKIARLERSGDISVIPRDKETRVVDVKVRDGVQTVRIEIAG